MALVGVGNIGQNNPGLQNRSAGSSQSSGSSTSTSANTPVNMQSPQSEWALQLAQIEQQLGANTYNWANQQYANTSALTDQTIGNYLGNAGAAQGMAGQAINQYNQQGVPQINNLFNEANTYASNARIAQAEGGAESDSMQASDAARKSEETQLQSYGADPTSGRYAGLDEAQRMQAAASAAGAGQTAGLQTVQTGQALRGQAVAAAEQLPGEAVNAINAGYSGLSGAENAGLANVNTGVSALGAANNFLNTASQLKYPPVGQAGGSNSKSTQQSTSTNVGASTGLGGGGGTGLSDSPSSGQFGTTPTPTDSANTPGGGGYGGYGWSTSAGGGGSDGGGGYAHGGAIGEFADGGMPTTGGGVPASASPSGGIQTDDIPARLNAHEFVIPQDVALWKGQEHFHKLIGQSREARQKIMGQTQAQPSLGPPAKGPPSFVSAHMGRGAI